MSKSTVKKFLKTLTQEQLLESVMELYSASKEAKNYLDFMAEPNVEKEIEKRAVAIYKKLFRSPNYPAKRLKFADCNRIITEFEKMNPGAGYVAQLMWQYYNYICEALIARGYNTERAYSSAITVWKKFLAYIEKHGLMQEYYTNALNLTSRMRRSKEHLGLRMHSSLPAEYLLDNPWD